MKFDRPRPGSNALHQVACFDEFLKLFLPTRSVGEALYPPPIGTSLRRNGAANSSPPPCGEGMGVGGRRCGTASSYRTTPPPRLLPHKGGGSAQRLGPLSEFGIWRGIEIGDSGPLLRGKEHKTRAIHQNALSLNQNVLSLKKAFMGPRSVRARKWWRAQVRR